MNQISVHHHQMRKIFLFNLHRDISWLTQHLIRRTYRLHMKKKACSEDIKVPRARFERLSKIHCLFNNINRNIMYSITLNHQNFFPETRIFIGVVMLFCHQMIIQALFFLALFSYCNLIWNHSSHGKLNIWSNPAEIRSHSEIHCRKL